MRLTPAQERACTELDRCRMAIVDRDYLIACAYRAGVPVTEIARRIGLSRQRVHELLGQQSPPRRAWLESAGLVP